MIFKELNLTDKFSDLGTFFDNSYIIIREIYNLIALIARRLEKSNAFCITQKELQGLPYIVEKPTQLHDFCLKLFQCQYSRIAWAFRFFTNYYECVMNNVIFDI